MAWVEWPIWCYAGPKKRCVEPRAKSTERPTPWLFVVCDDHTTHHLYKVYNKSFYKDPYQPISTVKWNVTRVLITAQLMWGEFFLKTFSQWTKSVNQPAFTLTYFPWAALIVMSMLWAVHDQDEEFVFPKIPKFSPAKKNLVQQGEGASHQPAIYKFWIASVFLKWIHPSSSGPNLANFWWQLLGCPLHWLVEMLGIWWYLLIANGEHQGDPSPYPLPKISEI